MELLVAAAKPAILQALELIMKKKLLSDTVSKQFVIYGNKYFRKINYSFQLLLSKL